jgi:hypothetical protein
LFPPSAKIRQFAFGFGLSGISQEIPIHFIRWLAGNDPRSLQVDPTRNSLAASGRDSITFLGPFQNARARQKMDIAVAGADIA